LDGPPRPRVVILEVAPQPTIFGAPAIATGFIPRRLQLELRQNLRRFNVIVCHRRFGKTVFAINHQIDKMLRNTLPSPRAAYLAPTYGQAKRIVWDYLKNYTEKVPGTVANEADLRLDYTHNRARQMLLSAENPASLRGIYLDDVLLDEYAEMDPAVWSEVIRPTLNDRKGSAIFIGTPKGQNNFHKLYEYATQSGDPEWFGAMYKASETGIIHPDELASARRTMTEDEYEQEYECSFNAGLAGAYFAKELSKAESEGRVGNFPYDPALAVDTYWDLGINDMAAVWFVQSHRGLHRCIDYYEVCGSSIPEVVEVVKKKPYALGEYVFPHDADTRDFSTGKSQLQIFYNHGCRPSRVVPRVGSKREGINAARMIMPLVQFDRVKCKRGLEALANYQRKWNSKNNVFEESPLHNWASNGADAFQCFGLGQRGESRDSSTEYNDRYQGEMKAETAYNVFGRLK
jgi:phage terminase large subunit